MASSLKLDISQHLDSHPDQATLESLAVAFPDAAAGSLDRYLRDWKHPTIGKRPALLKFPESAKPKFQQEIHRPGPSIAVFSDAHAPYHDNEFMDRVTEVALAWGVNEALIQGDLLDMASFSRYPKKPSEVLESELEMAELILKRFSDAFTTTSYCMGNHELMMIARALNFSLDIDRWRRLFCLEANVLITEQEWITMDSPLGKWALGHPQDASILPTNVPRLIADVWTEYHIAGGHGHLAGVARSKDGRRFVVDTGMCADRLRLQYGHGFSKRPRMCQGALIIKDGFPHLFFPESDFGAMRKAYA